MDQQMLLKMMQMYQQQQAANPGAVPDPTRPAPAAAPVAAAPPMDMSGMAGGAAAGMAEPAPTLPGAAPPSAGMAGPGMVAAQGLQQAGGYLASQNAPNVAMEQDMAMRNQGPGGYDERRKQLLLQALQQGQMNGRQ